MPGIASPGTASPKQRKRDGAAGDSAIPAYGTVKWKKYSKNQVDPSLGTKVPHVLHFCFCVSVTVEGTQSATEMLHAVSSSMSEELWRHCVHVLNC